MGFVPGGLPHRRTVDGPTGPPSVRRWACACAPFGSRGRSGPLESRTLLIRTVIRTAHCFSTHRTVSRATVMTDADRIPRVLVVDDEPNIRELVQVALKFHGCTVSTAVNGTDAMRQAEATRPDLIVLDVMLPDIDGFEVCRRLRASGNEVPVIFLTARDTSSDTVTGLAIGGDDYATKPFSIDALVARVRAVLRRAARSAQPEEP